MREEAARRMRNMNAPIREFHVLACWDSEAEVWYVAETDVPGLATEAPSIDALAAKLRVMVPEMLEANGVTVPDRGRVPFELLTKHPGTDNHC